MTGRATIGKRLTATAGIIVVTAIASGASAGAAVAAPSGSMPGSVSMPASVSMTGPVATSDYIRDGEYWLDQYGIRSAWTTSRGKGVTIAVIDTGVDGSVADLAGAVKGGKDFSGEGSANGQTPVGDGDEANHGTMVASLAAGRGTGAGLGLIGVAPDATIMPISIGFGSQTGNSDEQVAEAVRYAVDHGARVINMSLTRNTLSWPESWDDAFLYAMQHNVVVVAAAGNRGSGTTEVGAPATMPGVLTVAGVDRTKKASTDASSQGITIGVSAPSEQLLGAIPGGQYVQWEGTSGATPIVSGVVALVMAAYPKLTAANVINRIVKTASPAGAAGVDPIYGYGLLNAASAVRAQVASVKANPMGDLAAWIHLNRRAPVTPASPPPTATAAPVPKAGGVVQATNPIGSLYPTATQLRDVGLPLGVIGLFLAALVTMIVLARRHFRSSATRD